MKRVMVDQGSCAEIMYLDLYRGLSLKPKDLTAYNLVSFDGKVVIPKGQIRLLMYERPRPRPVLYDVRPNPREWVESCYCLSK